MKKFLIISILLLAGCSSVPQRIDSCVNDITQLQRSREITIKANYNDAFQAAVNVFHDLNISVLKKDYPGKVIIGSRLPEEIGSSYGVLFETPDQGSIKIIVKAKGFYYDDNFILDKIKEEISLIGQLR